MATGNMHNKFGEGWLCKGCGNKNNPLGKISSVTVKDFVTKFYSFSEEYSGNICSKFRYNISCYLKFVYLNFESRFFYANKLLN